MTTAAELLAAYHELRDVVPSRQPAGVVIDQDGPLVRVSGGKHQGYVVYRDLAGAAGAELDALIERTRDYFSSRDEAFEWKTHSYDEPADLPDRLTSAGFVAGEIETVVIALAGQMTDEPPLPAGVSIRQVTARSDFERIASLHTEIWNEDWSWLAQDLADRQAANPEHLAVFVAEAESKLVTVAWLVRDSGSDFATLWGGATRPGWRGQGVYRAMVARRAQFAVRVGARYLQVDASADSAPILQRLGFVAVATTTPYVWTPAKV